MSLMRRENVWEERNEHEKDWVIHTLNCSHVSSLTSKNLPRRQDPKTLRGQGRSLPYPAMIAPMLAITHSEEFIPMIPTPWKRSRPT